MNKQTSTGYRELAFACYQQLGRIGAPASWLDALLDASEGRVNVQQIRKLEQFDPQPFAIRVEGTVR